MGRDALDISKAKHHSDINPILGLVRSLKPDFRGIEALVSPMAAAGCQDDFLDWKFVQSFGDDNSSDGKLTLWHVPVLFELLCRCIWGFARPTVFHFARLNVCLSLTSASSRAVSRVVSRMCVPNIDASVIILASTPLLTQLAFVSLWLSAI